ncbi:hypothetical protein D3C71_1147260 [compost metagenome]
MLLRGFLLPEHRLGGPLVNPVAAAITDHRVVQIAVGTIGLTHDDTRLHVEDFAGVNAAPNPHQTVNHAIPVRYVFAVQGGLHRRLSARVEATNKGRRFRVFETRFEQGFAKIRLGHCALPP